MAHLSRPLGVVALCLAIGVAACSDDTPTSSEPQLDPPRAGDLGDASVDPDAFPGFYVLSPLVPEQPSINDTFNPTFRVSIRICLHVGDPSESEIFGFDACAEEPVPLFGPDDINVSIADEFYKVNYDTDVDGPDLLTERHYRIFWLAGGSHLLGYRDVFVADPAPTTPPPTTQEAFGLRKGETVPLKVFIGTICDLPCGAGSINLVEGGEVPIVDESGAVVAGSFVPPQDPQSFSEDEYITLLGRQVTGSDSEICLGPDFDGILVGPCFDIDATAPPSERIQGATISICIDENAIESSFGLQHAAVDRIAMVKNHDGELRQLAQAPGDPFCEPQEASASSGPLTQLAKGAVHMLLPFAYPPALYAIDLNDSSTDITFGFGSHYSFFIPGTGGAVEEDLGVKPAGTDVTPVVRVLDAAEDGLNGVSIDWSVAVGGGSVASSTTSTGTVDGTAGLSPNTWTLGPPGPQELHATILGITDELLPHSSESVLEPLTIVFTAVSCEQGFGAPSLPVDGTLSPEEWECANSVDFTANVSGGSGVTATLYWMNDGDNLYQAVKLPRESSDRVNTLRIDFDNTLDGATADDDVVGYEARSSLFFDHFLSDGCANKTQSGCSVDDRDEGGTRDGDAAFANDGTFSMYELWHPLDSGDGRDFSRASGQQLGMFVTLQVGNGAQGNTQWPGFRDYLIITIQ